MNLQPIQIDGKKYFRVIEIMELYGCKHNSQTKFCNIQLRHYDRIKFGVGQYLMTKSEFDRFMKDRLVNGLTDGSKVQLYRAG